MRAAPILICLAVALSACAPQPGTGPEAEVPTLSQLDMDSAVGQAEIAATPADTADQPLSDAPGVGGRPVEPEAAPEGGLLGFFRQRAEAAAPAAPETSADRARDSVLASLPAETRAQPAAPAPAATGGGGFLAGLLGGGGGNAPTAQSEVGPNEAVAFGRMARLCGVDVGRLATAIETHQRYRLYDTAPGQTSPRNWYITGFDDGCARQFTAALALFGTVETHESLRYGAASSDLPMTATDSAYKDVKSRVCRVGRNAPCGARLARLDRTSVFVTVYESFGGAARWMNAFLHDGDVAAIDIASN
ncbi:hypothetical protein FIU97_15705 [Roseivivax sp. THAF40]|uniref:hypothetical protein n=1 Tax=unclassified Roseivivax TaxID=2639302 RepID=UPI001268F1F3|nr:MULTISPECIES: hypothetical protein [unclassified Roseivivax]QFS84199.1 hypothetical protein FIV09_15290 [Roseivivax sp. THAF197b]QFT48027.1 hypothetical protein FIU97_15705 [Roseivivax sp. THAF40]